MVRVSKCDVCSKPARRGTKIGPMYVCPICLAEAEASTKLQEAEAEYIGDVSSEVEEQLQEEPSPKGSFARKLTKSKEGAPHVIVEARAGTGKTTTLIEGLKAMRDIHVSITPSPQQASVWEQLKLSSARSSVCFVAFNKSIATELQRRVPEGCQAMTMHSMGYKAVSSTFGRTKVDPYRVSDIISEISGRDIRELRKHHFEMIKAVENLVGLCKMNLVDATDREALWELVSYYDVDLNGDSAEVFNLVPKVLERCKDVAKDHCIDFNDMIWLPVALNLPLFKYDVLLVDEAQDLNRCQQELALKAGSRLILCGDPKQAIYGFAGADAESMKRMQATLEATPRGCVHLPLTVTRRCGKAIVTEAQKIVPDFEAWETNPEGLISHRAMKGPPFATTVSEPIKGYQGVTVEKTGYQYMCEDGDMCLCRVNAPLVSECFKFLKAGRKAQIQGRDVGQGLISTIKKLNAENIEDLSAKLSDWHYAQIKKETAKRNPNENKLIALEDRVDCLECFIEGQETVQGVIDKINSIFTDDKETPGIKLSSIHKAKGLEAKRVFFLRPEGAGCPHPMAKSKWAIEQEWNLVYVATTRAIEELVYVS